MKKLIGVFGTIAVIMILFGIKLFFTPEQVDNLYVSAKALYGTDTITLTEDETFEEGTTNNPFVILEVVPYEGYAEIGYLIQGCEPIPMEVLTYDKSGGALVISTTDGMVGTWNDEYIDTLASGERVIIDLSSPVDMDATKVAALTDLDKLGKWRNAGAAQYGYYEKVADGTGDYYQEKRTINSTEAVVFIKATATMTGNYKWVPYADSTKPDGTHTIRDMWDVTGTWDKDRIDTYQTKYYRGKYNIEYHNKFLKEVLQLSDADISSFNIVVVTITPEKLSLSQNFGLIDKVDLISFAPNSHYSNDKDTSDIDNDSNTTEAKLVALWEKYNASKKISTPATSFGFDSGYTTCNDLTWEATVEILRKASIDNSIAPLLFDARIYNEDTSLNTWYGSNQVTPVKKYSDGTTSVAAADITSKGYFNNISKLYLVMEQMNPAKFYHEYIETNLIQSVPVVKSADNTYSASERIKNGTVLMTTAYYKDQQTTTAPTQCNIGTGSTKFTLSAVAWSIHTFLPYTFFANQAALESNEVWKTIGIDNYAVINSSTGNVSLRHNIYTYDGDKALTKELTSSNKINYNLSTKEAFEYLALTSGTISPARGINYLLNLQSELAYNTTDLRILEIEPCKDYIWNGPKTSWNVSSTNLSTLTKTEKYERQFFTKFFPNFNGNVTITTMTSAEYIGKVDDINTKYDMIIFGVKNTIMAKVSGTTVYNDTALNGKSYLHNGDLITVSDGKLQGLDDDNGTNTYRYSGNDITNLKYQELVNYMKAGNPIIFDTGFYNPTNKKTVNTTAIDQNSYIYNLANEVNKTTTYVNQLFSVKGFDSEGMSIYQLESKLAATKCKIIFGNTKGTLQEADCKPVTYKDRTVSGNGSLSDAQVYINGNNQSFRTLQYKFFISSDAASSSDYYTAKLYIDINADGKYDEATEKASGIQIMTETGYAVNYKKLQPGVSYTLSRTLEVDYFGVLPWKLEIVSNSNSEIRDSVIDYCALKTKPEEKVKLYILQIKANDNANNGYDNNLDLELGLTDTSSPFYHPLHDLQDYEIHIVSWTVQEFSDLCDSYSEYTYILSDEDDYNAEGKNMSNNDDGDEFYDFDMIIMGFADCYSDIGSDYALNNLQDFIEEGKSVLFTHDTTSFVNKNQANYGYGDFWGYGLNKTFRNTFGMDRFGVMLGTEAERINVNKDYATKNSSSEKLYSGYIQGYSNMILNRYAAQYIWVDYVADRFVEPNWGNSYRNSSQWTFVAVTINNWPTSNKYAWTTNGPSNATGYWIKNRITSGDTPHWEKLQYLSHSNVGASYFETNKVTKVNQGQLTVYPYNIPESFDVATTHAQYYQLDLENDDIVVWYCLSDDKGGSGRYSTTPNDVRNNYYIYNLGNITYSGVGHSTVTSVMEAKLFANTMIGAYTATAKAPQIKITNRNTSADAFVNYVYVDYDIYNTALASGSEVTTLNNAKDSTILVSEGTVNAQWVKFRIEDNNILFNKKIYVNFTDDPSAAKTNHLYYMVDTGDTADTADDIIMTKKLVNGIEMYEIDASEEYAIAVPLSQLNVSNMSSTIGINVTISYGKTSSKTKTAMTTFKLIRRGLFDLD